MSRANTAGASETSVAQPATVMYALEGYLVSKGTGSFMSGKAHGTLATATKQRTARWSRSASIPLIRH